MRSFLQPVYDAFKLGRPTSLESTIQVALISNEHPVPLISTPSSPRVLARTLGPIPPPSMTNRLTLNKPRTLSTPF